MENSSAQTADVNTPVTVDANSPTTLEEIGRRLAYMHIWNQDAHRERMAATRQVNSDVNALRRELTEFRKYVETIESQAQQMMSPDAMMDMASKFLGGKP